MANIFELTPKEQDDPLHANRADFLIALAASKDYDFAASPALTNEILSANAKLEFLKTLGDELPD
jgi:hypothetical protein